MTEQENRKTPPTKASPPKEGTENLLSDFGAQQKKAPPSPAKAEAAPAPKKPSEGTSSSEKKSEKKPEKKPEKKETPKEAPAPKAPAKKATSKSTTVKEKAKSEAPDKKMRTATTATPSKPKKEKAAQEPAPEAAPRSAKPAHRVLPFVLLLFAIVIAVALLLNLICNPNNQLEDPHEHMMSVVGYYICYALFGLFGPAVFVLPLLLFNLSFFWKRYIDRRIATPKILLSLVFLLLLGAVIHVFCLWYDPSASRTMEMQELFGHGAKMTGGGLLGGMLGQFFYYYLGFIGSVIVGFLLLAGSGFYVLGLTPQKLWASLTARRRSNTEQKPMSISEEDAEAAKNRAKMEEKIRRVTTSQQTIEDGEALEGTDGAVEALDPPRKKDPDSKLAPMPIPRLDPNDGSRPFVPREVGQKLNEQKKAGNLAKADAEPTVKPAAKTEAPVKAEPVQPAPAATAPHTSPSPAQNRDTAIDPIFPRSGDARQNRKMPKEDRNFDLRNVFIDLDEPEEKPAPRKHAPIPPEVPLTPTKKTTAATPCQTPEEKPSAKPAPAKAPSASAGKPTAQKPNGPQPVFRQADKGGQKDFGLSNEEFEKLEAQNPKLPKADATAKKPAKAPADAAKPVPAKKPEAPKKYVFPPISYLHPGEPMTAENRAEIEENMRKLAATLTSFHVRVEEINYSCGPTVTRYEVVLATGMRVRSITNLSLDIALALRSPGGVRIEAPIPGTDAIGIEVPNKTRSIIYLRDLIESKPFAEAKSKLAACLGADIAGAPLIFDIAKMPHLLIAGTTGSGKSVCINCIIMSLLYKVRPDEVKFILIDPKKVEFSIYKNIPHLMAPVVTTPKDAAGALQAAVEEMERRFEVFENVGVRDLKGYNEVTKDDPDMPFIPNIVIIIDELADLMMTAKNEVETAICRIAQKARAAGMHLIIGTQRPSADVVTGLIKANVPSSIAFAVKSQVDSRVILDHGGAEALTGRGDMLFVPIGSMRDTRVQGAFVDEKEVEKICEFIRATNGTAQYDERFTAKLKELAAQCGNKAKGESSALPSGEDMGDDTKYADAVRIAIEEKRISTSLLQRKLGVGYSRAAKLIDRMQSEGIVSAPDGSKPRTILISAEEYLEKFVDGNGGEA